MSASSFQGYAGRPEQPGVLDSSASSLQLQARFYLLLLAVLGVAGILALTSGAAVAGAFGFGAIVLLLAWCRFELAMLVMIFLLPFDAQRNFGGDFALFADLAKLLLIPPFLLTRHYRKLLLESKLCRIFLAVFLFNVAISLGRAIEPALTAKLLLRQFSAMFFGLMAGTVFRTKRKLVRVTALILAVAVLQGVYASYQWIMGGLGSFWYWLNPEIATFTEWEGRAMGALGHMNALAGILNMGLCLALSLLVSRQWAQWRLRISLGVAVMLIGLLMTFSRGGWFALALTAVLLFLIEFRRNGRLILVPVLLGLLLLPIAASEIGRQVYQRAANVEPISDYTRLAASFASVDMFLRHPLFGVGCGNWPFFFSGYVPGFELPFAHNLYLQVLSEAGLAGFLLFFAPLGYLIVKGLRFPLEGDLAVATLIRAYGFAMTGALAHGFVESWMDANPPYAGLFWTIVGLLIGSFALAAKHGNGRSRVFDRGTGDLKPAAS